MSEPLRGRIHLDVPRSCRRCGSRADDRIVVRLLLRDVVERARHVRADRPGVEPGEVVEAQNEPPFAGMRSRPYTRRRSRRASPLPQRRVAPPPGRSACGSSLRREPLVHELLDPGHDAVDLEEGVSMRSASGAGCMRTASLSSRRRRSVARASPPMSGRSAWRRRARVRGVGVEVDLHFGVRRDDRADVPPFDHDVALLAELALALGASLRGPPGAWRQPGRCRRCSTRRIEAVYIGACDRDAAGRRSN